MGLTQNLREKGARFKPNNPVWSSVNKYDHNDFFYSFWNSSDILTHLYVVYVLNNGLKIQYICHPAAGIYSVSKSGVWPLLYLYFVSDLPSVISVTMDSR